MNLLDKTKRGSRLVNSEDGNWLFGVPAIVADNQDPEKQHRVRVVIPSIDEDLIFDEWARQMVFCLGNGYGSGFIPPKGSEVVLFGQLGQKYNLFYASLYNEEMLMPNVFPNEMTVGIHAPGNLIFIAEQLGKIQAENIDIIADQDVDISGNNVKTDAQQLAEVKGNQVNLDADSQMTVHGSTVTINSDGSISISGGGSITISGGGAVQITGSSIKLFNRTVNPVGPPI